MTITITKDFKEKLKELNLNKDFIEEVGVELSEAFFDPKGETVLTFGYKDKRYMVEAIKKGEDVKLLHVAPIKTIHAK